MRLAYFDCPSGLAGNMIIGSLLDAGLDPDYLKKELKKLSLDNYQLIIKKVKKNGLAGTYFNVKIPPGHPSRNLSSILALINKSSLSSKVKKLSVKIFKRLAAAEAKVHGIPVNKIHFHEVGAVDAIIDIVGSCLGFSSLGIDKVFCSPLPNGRGKIVHAHGLLPNPAPAAVELLKGVPVYGCGIRGELVTPTGAAIITTLADSFGDLPKMQLTKIGCGAGSIDLPIPNLLRLFIGQALLPSARDCVLQIETCLDDLNPKLYPKVIRKIMAAGALDAYLSPVYMKKNRRGIKLIALCTLEKRDQILEEIFNQTTTLGVRVYVVNREILSRKFIRVKTKYGRAKIKVGLLGQAVKTASPEFSDCARLAKKHQLPVEIISRDIKTYLNGL